MLTDSSAWQLAGFSSFFSREDRLPGWLGAADPTGEAPRRPFWRFRPGFVGWTLLATSLLGGGPFFTRHRLVGFALARV